MTTVGERVKQLRKEKHITTVQLAQDIGVTSNAVSQWENDKRRPNFEMMCKLADYFKVDMDYLIGASDIRSAALLKAIADSNLSDKEISIIINYRNADLNIQKAILNMLDIPSDEEIRYFGVTKVKK